MFGLVSGVSTMNTHEIHILFISLKFLHWKMLNDSFCFVTFDVLFVDYISKPLGLYWLLDCSAVNWKHLYVSSTENAFDAFHNKWGFFLLRALMCYTTCSLNKCKRHRVDKHVSHIRTKLLKFDSIIFDSQNVQFAERFSSFFFHKWKNSHFL